MTRDRWAVGLSVTAVILAGQAFVWALEGGPPSRATALAVAVPGTAVLLALIHLLDD